jgi:hypothetical protein
MAPPVHLLDQQDHMEILVHEDQQVLGDLKVRRVRKVLLVQLVTD